MKIRNPTVSIVLPTYNGSKYIEWSIKSCLMQTFEDFELIIVNDGSTDNTLKIIEEYAGQDARIQIIHNPENKNLPVSLNIGFSRARGKYHTWTSDDNFYLPGALEEMVKYLEGHKPIDIVYCDFLMRDLKTGRDSLRTVEDIEAITKGNYIGACFLYKSEVTRKLNGYKEDLFCVEDYDFWLRACRGGFRFAPLHKLLYVYRYNHDSSLTVQKRQRVLDMTDRLIQEHLRFLQSQNHFKSVQNSGSGENSLLGNPFVQKKLAIWGWWQGKNLGDNWIRNILSGFFPQADFIDTCVHDLGKYDFVICGGGGLFIRNVIPPWDGEVKVPFGVLGLGAEFSHVDKSKAMKLAQKADFFYVRDQYSVTCMGVPQSTRSYDITFARPLSEDPNPDLNTVFFVWRDPVELLRYPDFQRYIGMVESYAVWKENLSSVFRIIREDNFYTPECRIEEMMRHCGFVVSGRYHGIVAAMQKRVPCIGIDLCPKIRSLMREAGMEKYCLKIGEIGAIHALVREARADCRNIRQKQDAYCKTAYQNVVSHIRNAMDVIQKRLLYVKKTGDFSREEKILTAT